MPSFVNTYLVPDALLDKNTPVLNVFNGVITVPVDDTDCGSDVGGTVSRWSLELIEVGKG